MALKELLAEFESVLNSYMGFDLKELKSEHEDISNAPDIREIRQKFADFMDAGRTYLESIADICLEDIRKEYRRIGIGITETPYKEVEVICNNHEAPKSLGKGLFQKNIPLENILFKKSNLIYSPSYKEKISKGKILCPDCKNPGDIGNALTTIILRQDVDQIEARKKILKNVSDAIQTGKGKIPISEIKEKILDPKIEKLGFDNLYEAFEATRSYSVTLETIFGTTYAQLLRAPVSIHIPQPILSVTYSEKDSKNLANKYIVVKYGEKKRELHDLCRVRFVPYGDITSCFKIVEILKKQEQEGLIKIEKEDDKTNGTETGYKAVHLDINPHNTGLICEAQIRTNDMDNLAETEEKQAHRIFFGQRQQEIDALLKENKVSQKEVYLIRLILDPTSIKEYRTGAK
ncbi:MAG: hypothetical protein Q8O89_07030 [Nanoarchaeota archaeon]|nr:hypothetical protein [Nanoarchaeota archaeon]